LGLVLEKIPFFILSLASCLATFIAQRNGGAVQPLAALPLGARLENALVSYALYILKMIRPADLAVPYLYLPPSTWPLWHGIAAAVFLAVISALAVRHWRRRPYLLFGWLWFLGILVPVIGIVQVGNQSLADRYTYIPLLGPFIMLAWAGAELIGRRPRWRAPLAAGGLAALVGCAALTRLQLGYWRDTVTLFGRAVEVTKDNCIALTILGDAWFKQGNLAEAGARYTEALRIRREYGNPYNDDLLYDIGVVLLRQGKRDDARSSFTEAARVLPTSADVRCNLGVALNGLGLTREAIARFREALILDPKMPDALNNLAWILASDPNPEFRDGAEAVRLAEQACQLTGHRQALLVGTLGAACAEAGRFADAIAAAEQARALALAQGRKDVAARNEQLLELYRAGRAFHQEPRSNP